MGVVVCVGVDRVRGGAWGRVVVMVGLVGWRGGCSVSPSRTHPACRADCEMGGGGDSETERQRDRDRDRDRDSETERDRDRDRN